MPDAAILPVIAPQSTLDRARPNGLLNALLDEQQTAVEQFSQWHNEGGGAMQLRRYETLIPLSHPAPGQQYAFEVDLDLCSGCKSCVVACHNLNGLEETELWRSVGLLHGGTTQLPVLQHVTTACHHCLEPACLEGCPVEAYEKDPITGIVRHLDDQCIGCQYCILKCPYDVPQYSRSKGIVRKCDMCRSRLAVNEAPACVQACPNRAIRITVVDRHEIAENAEANLFLPGAPEPGNTLPTTIYKTSRALPANLLPANYYNASPQHAHLPLVLMLVLTQMSVGAFIVEQAVRYFAAPPSAAEHHSTHMLHLAAALGLGLLGLGASVFHLGRPWLAYRAVIAWRTSWLSREAIAFGGFAGLAVAYAATVWWDDAPSMRQWMGALVAISGLAGVLCSTMIYASTKRVFWNPFYTGLKFSLTCLILGLPFVLALQMTVAAAQPRVIALLCTGLIVASGVKLLAESAAFCWLGSRRFTPLRRTALLMTGELRRITGWRFVAGVAGGIALPSWLLATAAPAATPANLCAAVAMLALCLMGELFERYLFFSAVIAPKMPGSPAT